MEFHIISEIYCFHLRMIPFSNDNNYLIVQLYSLFHISALRPFKCDECGKRLEKARTLRLHKLSVHEGKLKKRLFKNSIH